MGFHLVPGPRLSPSKFARFGRRCLTRDQVPYKGGFMMVCLKCECIEKWPL